MIREESMSAATKWRMISKVQKSCEKLMYRYDYLKHNGKVLDGDMFYDIVLRKLNEDNGWKYAKSLYYDYSQSEIFFKVCKKLNLEPIRINEQRC